MRRISNLQWILILATCALIVFLVGAIFLHLRLKGLEIVSENFTELVPFWLFWAIHTPLILILSRRFSFERRRLIKNLLVYLSERLEENFRAKRRRRFGLKNTRERLSELYGEDYCFSLSRKGNEWTIAQIVIPFFPATEQSNGGLR